MEEILKRKYNEYDVMSALQKAIRRGNEYEAGWWAYVLYHLNPYLAWKRLAIISAEDCDGKAMMLVDSARRLAEFVNTEKILFVVKVAVELARMKKDRTADDMICAFEDLVMNRNWARDRDKVRRIFGFDLDGDGLPKIPDVAKDGHTVAGKKLGRGFSRAEGHLFFWDVSSRLNPISPKYDEGIREEYIQYFKKRLEREGKDWDEIKRRWGYR